MYCLHGLGILHLDLRPRNILMSRDNVPWVTDFGVAFKLSAILQTAAAASILDDRPVHEALRYMAPELFGAADAAQLSPAADMHSFGMVLWEVFSGEVPHQSLSDAQVYSVLVAAAVGDATTAVRPAIGVLPTVALRSFVQRCWAADPTERPTFGDAREALGPIFRDLVQQQAMFPQEWQQFERNMYVPVREGTDEHTRILQIVRDTNKNKEALGCVW